MQQLLSSIRRQIKRTVRVDHLAITPTRNNIRQVLKTYATELEHSGIIENILPKTYSEQYLATINQEQRFSQHSNHLNSLTSSLGNPIWDLLERGGKRWRPVLCMLVAELFSTPRSEVLEIAALTEIIHNGSLIIDDIEDNSAMRRNKPCIHLLYGTDISINAGNFMYFAPMLALFRSPNYSSELKNEFVKIYLEETVQLHIGQAWDVAWHNLDKAEGEYPQERHYLEMTAQKTAVLARLATRMCCAYVRASPQQETVLREFVENMGVAFQIQDDIINLESEEMAKKKGYKGEDIHEGKLTLMVIHHLQQASPQAQHRLLQILKLKTEDPQLIEEAINLLAQSNSISYAKGKMWELVDEANRSLDQHFPPSQARELLKELALLGIKRTH